MPDELPRKLNVRAAEREARFPDNPFAEVEGVTDRPPLSELMNRLAGEDPVELDEPPEVTIRRLRGTG